MHRKKHQSGFTLVELAIVLVIIGLIVGGVLVGADLIKAATMQKTIRQFVDTDAGANTFRTKYNALPGDMLNPSAAFPTVTNASNNPGSGDGNTLIQAAATATTATATMGSTGESAAFYYELNQAGYVKDSFTAVDMGSYVLPGDSTYFLPSALGRGAVMVPTSTTGKNYLVLTGKGGAATAGLPTWTKGIIPLEASSIDGKLDDGNPATGGVISVAATGITPDTAGGGTAGAGTDGTDCYNSTSGAYDLTFKLPSCNISYRTSF